MFMFHELLFYQIIYIVDVHFVMKYESVFGVSRFHFQNNTYQIRGVLFLDSLSFINKAHDF